MGPVVGRNGIAVLPRIVSKETFLGKSIGSGHGSRVFLLVKSLFLLGWTRLGSLGIFGVPGSLLVMLSGKDAACEHQSCGMLSGEFSSQLRRLRTRSNCQPSAEVMQ